MKKIIIAMALMAMTTTITAATKKDKAAPQRPPVAMCQMHGGMHHMDGKDGCKCKNCKKIRKHHKKMMKQMKKGNLHPQAMAMHKMTHHGAPAVMHSGRK